MKPQLFQVQQMYKREDCTSAELGEFTPEGAIEAMLCGKEEWDCLSILKQLYHKERKNWQQ